MKDIRLALMTGADIPIPELGLILHQPRIKEIALIGENQFFSGVQCLTINKSFIQQQVGLDEEINNFDIFISIMKEKEAREKKEDTIQLLSLLFPNYKTLFSPRSLILQKENEMITIDATNFEILQQIFKEVFCISNRNSQQAGFNPGNKRAKEIAEKLMKGRQRVAEINGTENACVFGQYLSILALVVPGTSFFELLDFTVFQLYDVLDRYQLYASWDIDIRSRLAGADIKEKPVNWMKNIH